LGEVRTLLLDLLCDLPELIEPAVECFGADIAVERLLEADLGPLPVHIHRHDLVQIERGLFRFLLFVLGFFYLSLILKLIVLDVSLFALDLLLGEELLRASSVSFGARGARSGGASS
jgi:hypothetical protein